ncbi:hypothetical protein OAK19_00160 [Aureispira]|nr:hypothetical protein [Aureispira sp.]
MTNFRKFQVSDDTFNGFICELDINTVQNKEDICNLVLNQMEELFTFYKFEGLLYILKSKSFHIHSVTFEEIKNGNDQEIFYICAHCNDAKLN